MNGASWSCETLMSTKTSTIPEKEAEKSLAKKKLLRSPLNFYLRPRRWALSFACVLSKSETNYEYASEAMRNVSKFDQVFIRF
jgi:hypothetical protein